MLNIIMILPYNILIKGKVKSRLGITIITVRKVALTVIATVRVAVATGKR
jgi:hypothetical protein